ncbi:MAG TPA: FAD-dependent oxidoreductase [Verrucomicrobia bacterium]|nr:MAG: pyridine nucleotide-disulfide oxidoreductase [Lentisphaerae bacterium GWF2_57_35]HBA85535.1 FAD-dependent oxidoreductase [Verrucomicrobiota bacterium]
MEVSKAHVAIVGAGFGGLEAARQLAHASVRITMIDRHNYHLFQPLLYQVATAGLGPTDIARPVRAILRRQRNLEFRMTEVTGIELAARKLATSTGEISYDYLILAVGGETSFFGLQSVAAHAFGLKDLDDAVRVRNHVLEMFELAVHEKNPEVRRALLTFVVVGGGPTGVECAGALSELIRLVLIRDYHGLNIKDVRVLLLEASDKLLPVFPETLRESAAKALWEKHIEVRFGAMVTEFDGKQLVLKSGETIPAHTMIWAAGVRAVRWLDSLGLPQDRQGRIKIKPTIQTEAHPEVYVIGDAASLPDGDGQALPMVAPVAVQQARTAAANIQHALRDEPLESFDYHDRGSLATIGRNAAVARFGRFGFHGFFAWLLWLGVHITFLIGFRNRLMVLINWAWDYLLYDRAVRLITPNGAKH